MTTYLCIGGPLDGQRWTTDGAAIFASVNDDSTVLSQVRYSVRSLRGEKQRFDVLVPDNMTGDEILQQLIDGYQPDEPHP